MSRNHRLYLTIHRGPSAAEAEPVVATEDQELIRAVGRELGARLGLDPHSQEGANLRLLRDEGEGDGGE